LFVAPRAPPITKERRKMAGKVKKKGDDAPQSKTARASLRTGGGKAEFIAAADAPRIVPLGGGTHAYILDPRDGKTRRFKVASDEFFGALATLEEAGFGDRMKRDLVELSTRYPQTGWSQAVARIDAPAVDEAPEVEVAEDESDENAA
jgi:hypothetical protein